MKLIGKCVAFCKENKIIVAALAVVLLSFVFLSLPGQFAHYDVSGYEKGHYTFNYNLSGYQFMFGIAKFKGVGDNMPGISASAQGIAIFVMLILCIPGLLFSKKSSFVSLLTTLALIVISILFFTISAASAKSVPLHYPETNNKYSLILWVPYLLGAFILLAGGAMGYRTFLVMKDEIKRPSQPKGPTYSYLKK